MSFKFDLSDLKRWESRIADAPDQIRFAAARALNDAVDAARTELIEHTWPAHVQVKNTSFMNASLTTRGSRATKNNLVATLYDRLDRANLKLHETGGVKRPKRASLAIPSAALQARRGARGIPKNLRPRNLGNSFRKGDVIYQRTGKKKNKGLKLMYVLKTGAPIRPTVPFHQDFNRVVRTEMGQHFKRRFAEAMKSRRK